MSMICDNWDPLWEYVFQGVCMSLCAMICLRPGMSQICGYVDIYKAQNKDIQTLCLSSELSSVSPKADNSDMRLDNS